MKRISFFTIAIVFVFSLFTQPVDAKTINFKDVRENHSHYDGVQYLTNKGIINGYSDNTFRPDNTITRSQTAVLFTRAMDLTIPKNTASILKNYSDITIKHDYADAIAATYDAGIFKGSNGRFNDGSLTREQMATVLVRAYGLKDTGKNVNANLSNIDPSHRDSVKILSQHKITNQSGDFRPKQYVTRGQFATFLYRVMDNQETPKEETESDTVVVYNERELANALSASSSYKVVELGKAIELTDTISVDNEGVEIRGSSGGFNYAITGAQSREVFLVRADDVHFNSLRIFPKNHIGISAVSGEGLKVTNGFIKSTGNASSGIEIRDNYKTMGKDTAIIKNTFIEVGFIAVLFEGGLLTLENNTFENSLRGLVFKAVESPRSIKGNIFFNNTIDISTDYLPHIEKFLHLNHFDYGYPKILELN